MANRNGRSDEGPCAVVDTSAGTFGTTAGMNSIDVKVSASGISIDLTERNVQLFCGLAPNRMADRCASEQSPMANIARIGPFYYLKRALIPRASSRS